MSDLFVHGGRLVSSQGVVAEDLWIVAGKVKARGRDLPVPVDCPRLDARGKLVLPGLIDSQVHFREPGLEHKEDLQTGSLAAVAGGVTAFMEMPNTSPGTTNPEALADKLSRAAGRCYSDHAFFVGATADNAAQLGEYEQLPGCCGVKIFMGSSTGNLLVPDDATLERVLRSGTRRIAVHSEDEYRLRDNYANLAADATVLDHPRVRDVDCAVRSTVRLLDLVEKTGRRIHLLHVSTAEEVQILRERDLGELVTAEATPNHLFLRAPDCYESVGSLAQMNPPVRERRHQEAIRQGLVDGVLRCVGSDHAPHTREEKARPFPQSPSGIPGVQTILPLLLTAVRDGWLSLEQLVKVTAEEPVAIYGIQDKGYLEPGRDGDLVLVDPEERGPLREAWLRSKVGWSPFTGWDLAGWPSHTVLRGELIYAEHAPQGPARGQVLRYG